MRTAFTSVASPRSILGKKLSVLVHEEVSCFEEDRIWGTVAAILIFLPGWPIAMKMSTTIAERTKKDYARGLAYLLLLPSMLIFPFLLIFMKLASLFNPGPAWKEATIMLTIREANWEW